MVNECVQKWKGKSINFTHFLQICAVFFFLFFSKSWSILKCDNQTQVIQTSVPEIFDDVTDDVTWTEWSPALPLMSSKIAFEWCDSWLWFKWYTLLIWMGDFIFYSLAPEWNFRYVIFKQILVIGGWGISHQATSIIWANVDRDLCHHMVSLDQNDLIGVIVLVLQDIHHNMIVFCNISWIWTEFENNI